MTPRQHELLTFIRGFIAKNGYSPTLSEMQHALGLRSKSGPHRILAALRRDGFVAAAAPASQRSAVVVDANEYKGQRDMLLGILKDFIATIDGADFAAGDLALFDDAGIRAAIAECEGKGEEAFGRVGVGYCPGR